uniref:Putative ovule protein n=1 Tax=Solanum chacoense TaxID=4108 RepID=A0A0V0GH35_SOLCH
MQRFWSCWWSVCTKFNDRCCCGCCIWRFSWGTDQFSYSRNYCYCSAAGIRSGGNGCYIGISLFSAFDFSSSFV